MDKVLKYEKKFLIIHLHFIILAILYLIISIIVGDNNKAYLLGISILIVIYFLNFYLYKNKFYNKKEIFILSKFLYLFILGYFLINNSLFVSITVYTLYIFICLQIVLTITLTNKTQKIVLYSLTFMPAISNIIIFNLGELYNYKVIFFFMQFIMSIVGIYRIIDINNNELLDKLKQQKFLLKKNEEANKELELTKRKVQKVYEQIALQKYEMEQTNTRLNKINAEMYIQNELLRYISSTLELEQLMDLVNDSIVGAIGVDTCSLIIKNDLDNKIVIKSKSNYNVDVAKILKECLDSGKLDKYFEKLSPHINVNVDEKDYPFIKDRPVGSILIFPLVKNNKVYGLIISEHASSGIFDESNLQFFQSIATQINIAVNNASLYSKMEDLAKKDGLTGLFNRRYLQSKFNDLFNNYKKENRIISIALFDLDNFKKINDTYGHLFGDEAIKMAGNIANEYAVNNGGFAGRYGGEEFVIVLPDIDLEKTVKIIKEMHEEIKNKPIYYYDKTVYINLSIGITSYPKFGESAEDLLNRADNAMYYAKTHGRGRIKVDSNDLNKQT